MTTLLRRVLTVSLATVGMATTAGVARTAGQADLPLDKGGAAPGPAHSVPCTTVATTWPVSAEEPQRLQAPKLSIVRTDLRPKDVRLVLDGRFIGRARYFNGKNGYLFLEPGRYRLELHLGGYRTELFEIEAAPNCRFDIKHRMVRASGGAKETFEDPPGRGVPLQRVFGPVGGEPPATASRPRGKPDTSLRPGLATKGEPTKQPLRRDATLDIEVQPAIAAVFLDGSYLATGSELDRMAAPLAISSGRHVLEVRAEGYVTRTVDFEVAPGEVHELSISLEREVSQ